MTEAYTEAACLERRTALLAPRTGNVREELILELAEYFGEPRDVIERKLEHATEQFTTEWREKVHNPDDQRAVVRFYDESTTEIFDLADWHGADAIHARTVIAADVLVASGARSVLDYGSGIGSDAIVLAKSGLSVTLADVATPLLQFARWRCEKHGCGVTVVDLKRQQPPRASFDAAICFDVLEHIKQPRTAVRAIRHALRANGLFFLHAPFGADPERPMHLAHSDSISPRLRTLGLVWRGDLESSFPSWMWSPRVFQRFELRPLERFGYYVHDVWAPGSLTTSLARCYRALVPRLDAAPARSRDTTSSRAAPPASS